MIVDHCASLGQFFYKNTEVLVSQKNISGIIGNYNSAAASIISNCVARMEENNTDYDVNTYTATALLQPRLYTDSRYLGLDTQRWSVVSNPENPSQVMFPYVSLNFLGDWE